MGELNKQWNRANGRMVLIRDKGKNWIGCIGTNAQWNRTVNEKL